jgi:hypothetical protein
MAAWPRHAFWSHLRPVPDTLVEDEAVTAGLLRLRSLSVGLSGRYSNLLASLRSLVTSPDALIESVTEYEPALPVWRCSITEVIPLGLLGLGVAGKIGTRFQQSITGVHNLTKSLMPGSDAVAASRIPYNLTVTPGSAGSRAALTH